MNRAVCTIEKHILYKASMANRPVCRMFRGCFFVIFFHGRQEDGDFYRIIFLNRTYLRTLYTLF